MRLDYHIDLGHAVQTLDGKHSYNSTPTLTIAVVNGGDYAEVVIPLDELKEALDNVMD